MDIFCGLNIRRFGKVETRKPSYKNTVIIQQSTCMSTDNCKKIRDQVKDIFLLGLEVQAKMKEYSCCGGYMGSEADVLETKTNNFIAKVLTDVKDEELVEYLDGFDSKYKRDNNLDILSSYGHHNKVAIDYENLKKEFKAISHYDSTIKRRKLTIKRDDTFDSGYVEIKLNYTEMVEIPLIKVGNVEYIYASSQLSKLHKTLSSLKSLYATE